MSDGSGVRGVARTEEQVRAARLCLIPLFVIFVLGILCFQGFNLVIVKIGQDLGAPGDAQLITAISGVALGIACFVYGSLGDFVSLRKMTLAGIGLVIFGSVGGFLLHSSIWFVIAFRAIQTAGCQVAGSVFIVIVARYIPDKEKVKYFGIFTAGFNLATAIGVFLASILSTIDWSYLFLIPLISVLFIPPLYRYLSDEVTPGARVDVMGFFIFSCAVGLLVYYFSPLDLWILLLSLAFFVLFVIYIARAKNPFITLDWFKNKRWRLAVWLVPIAFSVSFFPTPYINEIGQQIYHMDLTQVPFYLLPSYLVATLAGALSGKIVDAIGHHASMIVSIILTGAGLAGVGLCVTLGFIPIAVCMCVYFAGAGLFYSPAYDIVLSTLEPSEAGRGIGINDLSLNVGGSIGMAIFASMIQGGFGAGFLGRAGESGVFTVGFIVPGAVLLFCLIYYLVIHSYIKRA